MKNKLAALKDRFSRSVNKRTALIVVCAVLVLAGAAVMIGGTQAAKARARRNNEAAVTRVLDFAGKARAEYETMIYATGGGRTVEDNSVLSVEGFGVIGFLRIDAIGLDVPVMANATDEQLALSVCRYGGAPWEGYTVIVGDEYDGEFGRLDELKPGDEVVFTAMTGREYVYKAAESDEGAALRLCSAYELNSPESSVYCVLTDD